MLGKGRGKDVRGSKGSRAITTKKGAARRRITPSSSEGLITCSSPLSCMHVLIFSLDISIHFISCSSIYTHTLYYTSHCTVLSALHCKKQHLNLNRKNEEWSGKYCITSEIVWPHKLIYQTKYSPIAEPSSVANESSTSLPSVPSRSVTVKVMEPLFSVAV